MAEQPDYSDSCMLAIYPPADIVGALAVPGGLDPDSLHVTVVYTGPAADVDIRDLTAAAIDAARAVNPFTAAVSGAARFTGGEQDVAVALIDAPQLEDLRRAALDALEQRGIEVPRTHGYTAHLSRAYLSPDEPGPPARLAPLEFLVGALSVKHGTTRIDIPLAARTESAPPPSIAAQAREAYAEGWARTGGPMTDRVKAGCVAAVEIACAHEHAHGILEATLRLGSLEGTWARIFQRRDELMAKQTAILASAWRDATARLDVESMVRQIRASIGLAEAAGDPTALDRAKQAARDAALTLLAWLPASAAWQRLRDTMRDLLRSGRAEGAADAIAIAGQAIGQLGIAFDLAFTDAYNALANLGTLWTDADGWLGKMLGRSADELGRALGELTAAGAPYEDMLTAAGSILDGASGDAVSFIVDWALQTGLSQGALTLYASEGVQAVSWVTAGDALVCPLCSSNEDNGPYAPSEFPAQPAHPRCRCCSAAEFDLSGYAQYFAS